MPTKIQTHGFIFAALSAAFYGTNPAFAVPLYNAGMNPISVLLLRYLAGLPFLAAILLWRGEKLAVAKHEIFPVAFLGICMAASSLALYEAYLYMNPGVASTLLFMYPVLTALIMVIFFHEKFRLITAFCLVLMGIGLYFLMIGSDGLSVNLLGVAYIAISSITYAIYLVMIKVSQTIRNLPTIRSLLYQLLFGSFLFIAILPFGSFTSPSTVPDWTCILGLALLPTVLSLLFTMMAIARIGPTPTAIFGALEPVTAVLLSIMILGESVTLREFFGGVLILIATLIVMLSNGKNASRDGRANSTS